MRRRNNVRSSKSGGLGTSLLGRDHGDLGIKDLGLLNVCFLLKLLHRLFVAEDSTWASWARLHTCLASLDGDIYGNHWDILKMLLLLYQAATSVTIGNGERTSFWYDAWADDEALVDRFSALYSHCVKKKLSVAQVRANGIDDQSFLVP